MMMVCLVMAENEVLKAEVLYYTLDLILVESQYVYMPKKYSLVLQVFTIPSKITLIMLFRPTLTLEFMFTEIMELRQEQEAGTLELFIVTEQFIDLF